MIFKKTRFLLLILSISLFCNIAFVAVEIVVKSKMISLEMSQEDFNIFDVVTDCGAKLAEKEFIYYEHGWKEQAPKKLDFFIDKCRYLFFDNLGYVPFTTAEEGWLLDAILENALIRRDSVLVEKIKRLFEKEIINVPITKMSQTVNGVLSIRFYQWFKEEKYRNYSNKIYEWLKTQRDFKYGILYGPKSLPGVDGYGMSTPFLMVYSTSYNCKEACTLGTEQIDKWIELGGANSDTGIPSMAVCYSDLIPVGYANWGRGIAWWCIGLSSVRTESLGESAQKMVGKLDSVLCKIRIEDKFFTQLICQSHRIDLSAELPIVYYLYKKRLIELSSNEINKYCKYLDSNHLMNSSGPNLGYSINNHYGPNPLADAFLLKIINEYTLRGKKHNR